MFTVVQIFDRALWFRYNGILLVSQVACHAEHLRISDDVAFDCSSGLARRS